MCWSRCVFSATRLVALHNRVTGRRVEHESSHLRWDGYDSYAWRWHGSKCLFNVHLTWFNGTCLVLLLRICHIVQESRDALAVLQQESTVRDGDHVCLLGVYIMETDVIMDENSEPIASVVIRFYSWFVYLYMRQGVRIHCVTQVVLLLNCSELHHRGHGGGSR